LISEAWLERVFVYQMLEKNFFGNPLSAEQVLLLECGRGSPLWALSRGLLIIGRAVKKRESWQEIRKEIKRTRFG
jgi:hypothetical protein